MATVVLGMCGDIDGKDVVFDDHSTLSESVMNYEIKVVQVKDVGCELDVTLSGSAEELERYIRTEYAPDESYDPDFSVSLIEK